MKKWFVILFIMFSGIVFGDDFVIDEPSSPGQSQNQQSQSSLNSVPVNPASYSQSAIGSVPTPDTIGKNKFSSEIAMYDNGGINTRLIVGILDILDIGISENFDGMIGYDKINVNIPSAYIKFTLLKNYHNFDLAAGFDSFAYGKDGTYFSTNGTSSTIYGFYTSAGWHYSLLGGNDTFTFGLRFPLLPSDFRDFANTSIFAGASAWVSSYFTLGLTLENWYVGKNSNLIFPSLIISFTPVQQFKVSIIGQYEIYSSTLNRIITMGYMTSF